MGKSPKKQRSQKQTTASSEINVDIVSDFVCPWCWLGYKQFLAAANGAKPKPDLTFRPYLLDPNVAEGGEDYKAYMAAKFGDGAKDRFKDARTHLEREGEALGIAFNFAAITRRPNSLNAHRLLKWAQGQDLGHQIAERLFKAYHEQGRDIGDAETLIEIAQAVGLDGALTRDLLAGDEDKLAIMQEVQFFRGLGVSGVPTFIYNGQFAVQGAQPAATHKQAFKQARQQPPAAD